MLSWIPYLICLALGYAARHYDFLRRHAPENMVMQAARNLEKEVAAELQANIARRFKDAAQTSVSTPPAASSPPPQP